MLAKLTAKNQITIPKKVLEQLPRADRFEVECRDGAIILRPVRTVGLDEPDLASIRRKMTELGLTEDSVADAVRWARGQ